MTTPMTREELLKEGARLSNWLATYGHDLMEDGNCDQEAAELNRAAQWIADHLSIAQQLPSKFSPGDAVEVRRIDSNIDEIVIRRGDVHIEQLSDDGWFMGVNGCDGSYWQFWFGSKNRKSHVEFRHTETITAEEEARRVAVLAPHQPGSLQMTPSTPATCKFCGTVASPNDEQNCSSLEEAYRQTPMRPHGCPWFEKDARKANPAPLPSSAAENTNSGALPEWRMTYNSIKAAFIKYRKTLTVMDKPANFDSFSQGYVAGWNAKESAPQETRGDEPQDWSGMVTRPIDAVIAVSAQDPRVIIAGIRRFGLASDGSDLRDLERTLAAPQQSPRLEREAVARIIDPRSFEMDAEYSNKFTRKGIVRALVTADAILALLSPDSTAVSSTSHCAHGNEPATCTVCHMWEQVASTMQSESEADRLGHEVDRLRSGYGQIMTGLTEGRVSGEDVVWFDSITTLYDFCGEMLGHHTSASSKMHREVE